MRGKHPCQKSNSNARFTVDYGGVSRVGLMRLLGGIYADRTFPTSFCIGENNNILRAVDVLRNYGCPLSIW